METISTLLGALTDEDLDRWAGPRVHKRGQGYVDRVSGLQRTGDEELVAWVRGTRRYATLVHLDEGGEHEWLCTCPSEWGPCKHAVAVVLAEYCGYIGTTRMRVQPRARIASRVSPIEGEP